MERWYLATCKTGFGEQDKAEDSLLSQMYEVFNPKAVVESIKRGVVQSNQEFIFPGYIFVKFDPEVRSASIINNSRGIRRLVTFGDYLAAVGDDIINHLQTEYKRFDIPTITNLPKPGQVVEIQVGPFAGLKAVFQEPIGDKRSFLLLNVLGDKQRIELDNTQFA